MTDVMHLLRAGEECTEPSCTATHVRVPRSALVIWEGTTWADRSGRVWDVAEMTPRHALNTYEYLHRHAHRSAMSEVIEYWSSPFAPNGEIAQDALDDLCDEVLDYPHQWLDTRPLVRALWLRALDGFLHETEIP